jgi:hypothetical protein
MGEGVERACQSKRFTNPLADHLSIEDIEAFA